MKYSYDSLADAIAVDITEYENAGHSLGFNESHTISTIDRNLIFDIGKHREVLTVEILEASKFLMIPKKLLINSRLIKCKAHFYFKEVSVNLIIEKDYPDVKCLRGLLNHELETKDGKYLVRINRQVGGLLNE